MKTKDFMKLLKKEGITIDGLTLYDDYMYFEFADNGAFRRIKSQNAAERTVVSVSVFKDDNRIGIPMIIVE